MKKKIARPATTKFLVIESKEFAQHQKSSLWYIGVSVLLVGFLILTVYAGDYLLTAVVVAAGIAMFRLAHLQVSHKKVELSDCALHWGDRQFGYHQFRSFWVGLHEDHYEIYLDQLNLRPTISFPVTDDQVESVLEALAAHLPFHAHKNIPLPDRVSRLLRL